MAQSTAGRSAPAAQPLDLTVAVIGAGQMAEALLAGWTAAGALRPGRVRVTNRSRQERLESVARRYGVHPCPTKEDVLDGADVVVLAVKPKDAPRAMGEAAPYLHASTVVVSVMAGVPLTALAHGLGGHRRLVRAMPNTGCRIAAGATALCAGPACDAEALAAARALFARIGAVTEVTEELFAAVTAVSGSGPAYVYVLVEAMLEAARSLGLPDPVARTLAAQTVLGAGGMLLETGLEPAELRQQVTSPGGTTAAALAVLDAGGVRSLFREAVRRAAERSLELAGGGVTASSRQRHASSGSDATSV